MQNSVLSRLTGHFEAINTLLILRLNSSAYTNCLEYRNVNLIANWWKSKKKEPVLTDPS